MAYSRTTGRRLRRYRGGVAMGGIVDEVVSAIKGAAAIGNDPYLPETICRVVQVHQDEQRQPIQVCTTTPDNLPNSVGLSKVVKPLRAYIYAQQNKWVYVAGAAVILGIPWLLGYQAGKAQ